MSIKIPIRTVYDNSNNAIGLSEFQSGEVVGYLHGGTGLSSLGSAGQVLQVNSGADGFEFGNKTSVNLNPYLEVANANVTFVTKSTALSSNTALVSLINDRIQVANAAAIYSTLTQLGNTNAYIANKAVTNLSFTTGNNTLRITTGERQYDATIDVSDKATNAELGATNTALRLLIADRIQVANAAAIYATKAYAASNTYVNAQIGSSNTSLRQYINSEIGSSNTNIRNYTDTTYETKAVALASNNALLSLINDRMQVANVSSLVNTEVSSLVDSAPETLNTLNELAAALGDDANFATTTATSLGTKAANTYVNATFATKAYAASNTYVNAQIGASNTNIRSYTDTTFVTKSTALTSNNSLLNLINDRIQVANVASAIRPSVSTITSNTSVDATDHNNAIIVNSSDTVVITIAASSGLTTGDTFKFYPVGSGAVRINLDSSDSFLGTQFSTALISTFSDTQINDVQNKQISDPSYSLNVTGTQLKIEVLYTGSGNFVLTK